MALLCLSTALPSCWVTRAELPAPSLPPRLPFHPFRPLGSEPDRFFPVSWSDLAEAGGGVHLGSPRLPFL